MTYLEKVSYGSPGTNRVKDLFSGDLVTAVSRITCQLRNLKMDMG